MKRVQKDKESLKEKLWRNKGKLIVGGLLVAGAGVGIYAYGEKQFSKGASTMKTILEGNNYKEIKKDVLDEHYREMFDDIFNKNLKRWIDEPKTGRHVNIVGCNQELDYLKHLLKNEEMRNHAKVILGAKAGDVVKTF